MIKLFTQMEYQLHFHEIQQEICNNINGLENVKILRPGYAIEYDFVSQENYF